jgi:hypothetical protein
MANIAIAEPNFYFADANCRFVDMRNPTPNIKYETRDRVIKEKEGKMLLGREYYSEFGRKDYYDYNIVAIVVSICEPYEKVQRELTEIAKKHFGVKSVKDFVERDYWKRMFYEPKPPNVEKCKKFARLEELGVSTKHFSRRKITMEKYNIVDEIKGYSELMIEIIDGNSIFGGSCAIVALNRTDYWRDWYRLKDSFIYLPIKGQQDVDIITETEIKLLKDLGARIGYKKSMKIFPMDSYYRFPLNDPLLTLKLKEEIDKCEYHVKADESNSKPDTAKQKGESEDPNTSK